MIPKKIHYCWLSQDPLPQLIVDCMETWRSVLPDYEIIRWDTDRFDVRSVKFVSQAYDRRKWAFASDYIRLFAVYNEGGIYLDSDVRVLKSFDEFLNKDLFIPIEYHPKVFRSHESDKLLDKDHRPIQANSSIPGIGLQAAIFGGKAGHPFLKACMKYYENTDFMNPDGSLLTADIAPGLYARIAEARGFVYDDVPQTLAENVSVLESKYFASSPKHNARGAFAIHCCEGSWREKPQRPLMRRLGSNLLRRFRGF